MIESVRGLNETAPVRQLLAPYIKSQRARLVRMGVTAIVGGLAEAATLVLIARIAFALSSDGSDVVLKFGPFGRLSASIDLLIGLAAGLVVVRLVLQAAYTVAASRASIAVTQQTRTAIVRLYLAAGWQLQAQQRDGRLQDLLTTYTSAVTNALGSFALAAVNLFNLAALLLIALSVSPVASLSAAGAAVAIGFMLKPLRAAVRRRSGQAATSNLDFATGVTELTSTLQEVRIFAVESQVGERLDELNRKAARSALRTSYASGAVGVVYQGAALMLMVGALAVGHAVGVSGISSLAAVVLIMLRSLTYAQAFQQNLQSIYQSAPYLEALEEEQARYRSSVMQHGGEPIAEIQAVAFDHVSFSYRPDVPVLRDVSFEVKRGEIVGIIGPSGAGKSTLVQLLLRLREPTSGRMLVNGCDARQFSLEGWYGKVTFVPQDPHLFAGSVADNIRFFRDGVDNVDVERAAKLAHIHEDITSWPRGYDTPVGERGGEVSGGQRQRLCIARGVVEEPDVMVLDEPTSALDVRSEALIRDAIADLAPHTTIFVIAHRLSTLAICDRIMVLLDGVLEGFDEPTKLEESNPFFQEALRLSGMRA